jgi:2-haloacid dehalogenase
LEAQEEGGPNAYKSYKQILEQTSLKLARNLGLGISEGSGKRFAESITKWPAFPDTAQTLRSLGRLGLNRTILSNIDRVLLAETISNNGLEVDNFITAQDVRSYKPNKEHWLAFFRKTGAKKQEVIHVANSIYHDIVPANELGIWTIWVNRYGEKDPSNTKPNFTITNLSEMIGLLEEHRLFE